VLTTIDKVTHEKNEVLIPLGMSLKQNVCPLYELYLGWCHLNGQYLSDCMYPLLIKKTIHNINSNVYIDKAVQIMFSDNTAHCYSVLLRTFTAKSSGNEHCFLSVV